jgi:hypothetical protein
VELGREWQFVCVGGACEGLGRVWVWRSGWSGRVWERLSLGAGERASVFLGTNSLGEFGDWVGVVFVM